VKGSACKGYLEIRKTEASILSVKIKHQVSTCEGEVPLARFVWGKRTCEERQRYIGGIYGPGKKDKGGMAQKKMGILYKKDRSPTRI